MIFKDKAVIKLFIYIFLYKDLITCYPYLPSVNNFSQTSVIRNIIVTCRQKNRKSK